MTTNNQKLRALSLILRDLEETFNANDLYVLLRVSGEPGMFMDTLANDLGSAASTVSRICARLGDHSVSVRGHGLISASVDGVDARRRVLYMTPKGQAFVRRLEQTIA